MHTGFGEAPAPSRRQCFRQPLKPLAYVNLGAGNGGIILNLGERGMAVQAVTRLQPGVAAQVRFELPGMHRTVDATAEVVWSDAAGQAGMRFLHLADPSRDHLREWMLNYQLSQVHSDQAVPAGTTPGFSFQPAAEAPPAAPLQPAPVPDAASSSLSPEETASTPPPPRPEHGGGGGTPSWLKDLEEEEEHSGSRRVALLAVLIVLAAAVIVGMGWRWATSPDGGLEATLSEDAPPQAAPAQDTAAPPSETAAPDTSAPAAAGSVPEPAAPQPALPSAAEAARSIEAAAASPASLNAVRLAMVSSSTRVTLEFDRPVRYKVGRLRQPERIYLDLHDTRIAVRGWGRSGAMPLGDAQLRQVRAAESGDGNTRVVLDLDCACEYTITLPPGAPPRVVIELLPAQ